MNEQELIQGIHKIVVGLETIKSKRGVKPEELTKRWLIEPLLRLLGYDFSKNNLESEWIADIRKGKNQNSADYALLIDGEPFAFVESKR
jgi:hypothetical protein